MFSAEALKEMDRAVAKYPPDQKRSAVMASLALAQDELGWLSPEAMAFVADYLGMPPIAVQEVATFYNMFDTRPPGRFKITICTNLPCQLRDADIAADYLKQKLGIDFNETTPDGKFTLKEGECMGACGDAPVLILNNKKMCSFMSHEKIDRFIADLARADSGAAVQAAAAPPVLPGDSIAGVPAGSASSSATSSATSSAVPTVAPIPAATSGKESST